MIASLSDIRSDDLSLRMRIPADKCFFENALLALDSVCEHYLIGQPLKERIKQTFESALNTSVELSCSPGAGLLELSFVVHKDGIKISVEDCLGAIVSAACRQALKERLNAETKLADSFKFYRTANRELCYSMAFSFDAAA